MFKRQQFEDSKSEETEPRISKRQRVNVYDDKEGLSLDEYEGEGEDIGYIPLLFVALPPPRKKSNRPIDMGEGTRSLNHLVCIPKIGLSYNC